MPSGEDADAAVCCPGYMNCRKAVGILLMSRSAQAREQKEHTKAEADVDECPEYSNKSSKDYNCKFKKTPILVQDAVHVMKQLPLLKQQFELAFNVC
ncbi:UNVERIFIED_CONTAM: hypothetical protein K2H54_054119 [Gekko kuhli]